MSEGKRGQRKEGVWSENKELKCKKRTKREIEPFIDVPREWPECFDPLRFFCDINNEMMNCI